MIDEPFFSAEEAAAVDALRTALRRAGRVLPYLMRLARLAQISPEARIASAGVFASGRIVVNPAWFLALSSADALFVAAHLLLHLALRSHERCVGIGARLANTAEDYIINDMLRNALCIGIPIGGLDCPGVADFPADQLAEALRKRHADGETLAEDAWSEPPVSEHLSLAGPFDALDALTERRWFPDQDEEAKARQATIAEAAGQAVELGVLRERLRQLAAPAEPCDTVLQRALDERYVAFWGSALQGWLEEAAPSRRTYLRRSRHQGERADIVLAARRPREWTLDLIFDADRPTPDFLQVLQEVGAAADVTAVRLWRTAKTGLSAEHLAIDELGHFRGRGGGTGEVRPLLDRLAADPLTAAAVVLTRAEEDPAASGQPYPVLWAYAGDALD